MVLFCRCWGRKRHCYNLHWYWGLVKENALTERARWNQRARLVASIVL